MEGWSTKHEPVSGGKHSVIVNSSKEVAVALISLRATINLHNEIITTNLSNTETCSPQVYSVHTVHTYCDTLHTVCTMYTMPRGDLFTQRGSTLLRHFGMPAGCPTSHST